GFIFGFQRRVWWPKYNPAVNISFIVICDINIFPPVFWLGFHPIFPTPVYGAPEGISFKDVFYIEQSFLPPVTFFCKTEPNPPEKTLT
ncbi:MAG: hypothetical protein KAR13_14710, partial [Desulfobulbaceae bacterium]|nr:hypothetical protein [Desulfobulbaceae bacterium]MCK5543825.1 hypothetical protein [Desulfobulbaceae bacterium]